MFGFTTEAKLKKIQAELDKTRADLAVVLTGKKAMAWDPDERANAEGCVELVQEIRIILSEELDMDPPFLDDAIRSIIGEMLVLRARMKAITALTVPIEKNQNFFDFLETINPEDKKWDTKKT